MSMFVSKTAKTSLALAVAVCLSTGVSRAAERVGTAAPAAHQSVTATPATFHEQPTGLTLNPAPFHEQPTGLTLTPATFHEQPTGLTLTPATFHEQPTGFVALQTA